MKRSICLIFAIAAAAIVQSAHAQSRTELRIPDIPGYCTLKCDFHMHTVFSDGLVWPTVRVDEAWREGVGRYRDNRSYRIPAAQRGLADKSQPSVRNRAR